MTRDGAPVPDCMLEVWQADSQGPLRRSQDKRALPNAAFRRGASAAAAPMRRAAYAFDTIMPGQVPDPDGKRRRRISCSRYSGAACCGISIRGSISAAKQLTTPTRAWR